MSGIVDTVIKALEQSNTATKIAAAAIPVGVLMLLANVLKGGSGLNVPVVEGGLPYVGNVLPMVKGCPWDTMTEWARKYGRTYIFKLFGAECLCISDAELLKVILSTKLSIFKKDINWVYRPFLVILGNGLVTADGDDWRRQRVLLSSHLRFDILELIPDMALRAVKRLAIKLDDCKNNKTTINMAEEFRHLTLQVIAEAVLSISPEESDATFAHMYLPIVEEGNLRTWDPTREYLPTPSWFAYRNAVAVLNNYVTDHIVKRWELRKTEDPKTSARKQDILDKLLGAIDPSDWNQATITQLCGEVKTFILAGHETSASMLTWALYELSLNKELRDKVISNANSTFGPAKAPVKGQTGPHVTSLPETCPDRAVLDNNLHFTECCLKESLRKFSNVPSVVRVASEDCDVGPHKVKKGTTIMVNIQGVHHDPEYWPEPLKYDPYRFFESNAEKIVKFAFLPFIDGPRMCLGQYLALLESKIVLSLVIQNYRFECVNVEEAGVRHSFMVPIIPQNGHWMRVY